MPGYRHDALRDVLVEDGEIVAPINVLRFDDTVYNLLGNHLESLDDRAEVILDPSVL